jgi:hypothetical protein
MPDPAEDLERLVRRLRSLPTRTWLGDVSGLRGLAASLAELGPPGHQLPDVAPHALPDVIAVTGYEAIRAGNGEAAAGLIRQALDATR